MKNNLDNIEECIFCKIINGNIKAEIVEDAENFIVMNDKFPVAEGHCLIIPKKHYPNILDVPNSLGVELTSLIKKHALRLIQEGKAQGFNVHQNNLKEGGQTIMHSHTHIIPRKEGDKIKFF